MRFDSLAFRLFAVSALWTLLALPIAGFIIHSLYRTEVQTSFDERLKTLLLVVRTDSDEHATTEPGTPRDVGEPLFEWPGSSWYWQIKPAEGGEGRRRHLSRSLGNSELPSPAESKAAPDIFGMYWMEAPGPNGDKLRLVEMIHAFGRDENSPRYSYIVAGPVDWPQSRVSGFRTRLIFALSLVGLGMMALTLFQVRFGLLPLRQIERGLLAIRSGQAAKLESKLPIEIEPLQTEINALITSNQDVIDRARTQVGNLAHALKTPLAVITNEAHDDKSQLGQKVSEQSKVMRDQIAYYLERAQMAARAGTIGRVTEVKPVVDSLQRALERIYRDKGVKITVACGEDAKFQGEKQDLEEMLGNLTDNACKWCKANVFITVDAPQAESRTARRRLRIAVEDDGRGLTEEQRKRIGKRGMRIDETTPGSGLGLSIVGDLAVSYSGSFNLAQSEHGGLKVVLELPAL